MASPVPSKKIAHFCRLFFGGPEHVAIGNEGPSTCFWSLPAVFCTSWSQATEDGPKHENKT